MPEVTLGKSHARRLREMYRSAGWPCQDIVEIELLAAGLLERVVSRDAAETVRVTDAGIAMIAAQAVRNRSAMSSHEALVELIARDMLRAGRIAWRGISLRAQVPGATPDAPPVWCIAKPDVFSIRNTTVETYVEPVVHEIKVRRADLLGDLKIPAKRGAYCDLGECWYVLGNDAKGRPIGDPSEVPPECGVILMQGEQPIVARRAPKPKRTALPFGVWMSLAKATPVRGLDEGVQGLLAPLDETVDPQPVGPFPDATPASPDLAGTGEAVAGEGSPLSDANPPCPPCAAL